MYFRNAIKGNVEEQKKKTFLKAIMDCGSLNLVIEAFKDKNTNRDDIIFEELKFFDVAYNSMH